MKRMGYTVDNINALDPDIVKSVAKACLVAPNHLHAKQPTVCVLTSCYCIATLMQRQQFMQPAP